MRVMPRTLSAIDAMREEWGDLRALERATLFVTVCWGSKICFVLSYQ